MGLRRLLGLARAREAFLVPDYATFYPELPPGVWISARKVVDMIRRGMERRQRPWPIPGPRLLADEHFLFRDGQTAVERMLGSWRGKRAPRNRGVWP